MDRIVYKLNGEGNIAVVHSPEFNDLVGEIAKKYHIGEVGVFTTQEGLYGYKDLDSHNYKLIERVVDAVRTVNRSVDGDAFVPAEVVLEKFAPKAEPGQSSVLTVIQLMQLFGQVVPGIVNVVNTPSLAQRVDAFSGAFPNLLSL